MIKVEGKNNISAMVVADSKFGDKRMLTLEIEYPRFIHSEVMTHRILSKNAASSRAIPINKMLEIVRTRTAMPVFWGMNQPGMVAKQEANEEVTVAAQTVWREAMEHACRSSELMDELGLHKQIPNRLTEPYQIMKTVISGTEWANLLFLRDHPDAQPEFQELAKCISEAIKQSKPIRLKVGEWHLPYVNSHRVGGKLMYLDNHGDYLSEENALIISVSCCAQVSYRKNDDTLEKAQKIFNMLNVGSSENPPHMSPCEHQATPINPDIPWKDQRGTTHVDRNNNVWSGNLNGFIQYRKTFENEAKW